MNQNAYNYKAIQLQTHLLDSKTSNQRPKWRETMRAALYGNIDLSNENESKIG